MLLPCFALADAAVDHLLRGAALFRGGDFVRALVEFEVAGELGARPQAAWYRAATLTQLHRPEEAVEAFAQAAAEAPTGSDALLDYYHAVACFEAHLLACAERLLANVGPRTGPKVAAQAAKVRASIVQALAAEPPVAAVDVCVSLAERALGQGRLLLALAYLREAEALSARRSDRYRADELTERQGALRRPRQGGAK